jgi:hypothetical protein
MTNESEDVRDPETTEPRKVSELMAATWEVATSDPDPLAALGATRALVGLLSTWESQLAAEAVAAGATWEAIGGSVGVSRQAAWERFHDHVHEFRRQVKADARAMRDRHRREWDDFKENVRSQAHTHHHRRRPPSAR